MLSHLGAQLWQKALLWLSVAASILSRRAVHGQNQLMLERTTLQLFRDCLRTAHHIGGDSAKGRALKQVVKEGFRKHAGVTDAAEISKLKADAVRALSNYLVMKSLNKTKK